MRDVNKRPFHDICPPRFLNFYARAYLKMDNGSENPLYWDLRSQESRVNYNIIAKYIHTTRGVHIGNLQQHAAVQSTRDPGSEIRCRRGTAVTFLPCIYIYIYIYSLYNI